MILGSAQWSLFLSQAFLALEKSVILFGTVRENAQTKSTAYLPDGLASGYLALFYLMSVSARLTVALVNNLLSLTQQIA